MADRRRHTLSASISIGQTVAGAHASLEDQPHKAYIVWRDGRGHEVASGEFDEAELRQEITTLEARGEDTSVHREALARLHSASPHRSS